MSRATLRHILMAASLLATFAAPAVHASPQVNDNAGTFVDALTDDNGLVTFVQTRYDAAGRRVVLAAGATSGTFETVALTPASFSAWGQVHLNATRPSDGQIQVWAVANDTVYGANGQTGTRANLPAPLPLSPSTVAGYTLTASLASVPAASGSVSLLIRLSGATVSPQVSGLRATWTPESRVAVRLEAPSTIASNQTLAYRVNVGVSFVDTSALVVTVPLPAIAPNIASTRQDQRLAFLSATENGALTPDGSAVRWNLGARRAGETFTLVFNARIPMGTWNGTLYTATASAAPGNGALATSAPLQTRVTAAPAPRVQRYYGAGAYRVNNRWHAFADSDVSIQVQGWNYPNYPAQGGETLFDAVVWDDVSDLVRTLGGFPVTGGPFDISDGGQYSASGLTLPDGTVVPPKSVYWTLGDLTVGAAFTRTYRVRLGRNAPAGPFAGGETLRDCATLRSDFASQLSAASGPACDELVVGVPATPGYLFAKGEQVREHRQITAGEDLRPPMYPATVKAAFGETVSYLMLTSNTAVSELRDITMIDKIPAGTRFEAAFLPPEANGTVWYYAAPGGSDASADAPPEFDPADGDLGPGWTTTAPSDLSQVSWVAFRVPRLTSTYFPDTDPAGGLTPSSVVGEIVVTIAPPPGPCPTTDVEILNRGLLFIHAYQPQQQAAVQLATPLTAVNDERTLVVPDLPSLGASWVSGSPSTANANQPLVYTLQITNNNPPNVRTPLDDALNTTVRVDIPVVQANGVPTRLLVDGLDAPGATVTWSLPTHVTLAYAAPIPPGTSRTATLRTRVPSGVLDGTAFGLTARATYADDVCGASAQDLATSNNFFGLPALEVSVGSNFTNGQTGTTLVWTLDYINPSPTPSTTSWVVDRVPSGVSLTRVQLPQNGQVWFSRTVLPALPAVLSPNDPLTDARIRANFQQATDPDGDGWVTSPFGAQTLWVAFLVDDLTLSPPQFVTGVRRTVRLEATVTDINLGAVIANQAAILSRELVQAISNKVNFTVTGRPGLRMTQSCVDVVATGASFTYAVDYDNDSANLDTGVTIVGRAPDGLSVLNVAHAWNDVRLDEEPGAAAPSVTLLPDGFSADVGPLRPLEGGRFLVTVRAEANFTSGTFLIPDATGTAIGGDASTRSGSAACTILVENADLYIRKLVDNPSPRAGEAFNYTLVVSNEGAHEALDVVLRDRLPAQLELIPGAVTVTPAPWAFKPSSAPTSLAGELFWGGATSALTLGAGHPGRIPGRSGDVSIILGARVKAGVMPGTTIRNCANINGSTGEDANYANEGCVDITTPLPDPWVTKAGPATAKPGERVTWTLRYGNRTNEVAGGVVVIDSLPDGPIPTADGSVDVKYVGHVAPNGEAVWFHAGGAGTAPAFNAANPGAGGWTQTPGGTVSHIAFVAGNLAPLAPERTVQVSAVLTSPAGELVLAGSTFDTCAGVSMAPGYRDQDPSNNRGCATVRVPGIDVGVTAACTPEGVFPGVTPGSTAGFAVTVANSGTVPAFGLKVRSELPVGLTLAAAGSVEVVDANGQPVSTIDANGLPRASTPAWTLHDGHYLLGDANPASANYYRRVGLRPGHRARLPLTLTVGDGVPNRSRLMPTARVVTDYGVAWTPGAGTEELLANNVAQCLTAVNRADPLVEKSVTNLAGAGAPADPGDTLRFEIGWNNAGDHPAAGVVIEDAIPEGLVYISGSTAGFDPELFTLAVSTDGGLTFGAEDPATAGVPDPDVTHLRLTALGDIPAPVGGLFIQTTPADFALGTHDGTRTDEALGAVVPDSGAKCERVTCAAPPECPNGTWTPEDACCPVCRPAVTGCPDGTPVSPATYTSRGCYDGCTWLPGYWELPDRADTWDACSELAYGRDASHAACLKEATDPSSCAHIPCGNTEGTPCSTDFRMLDACLAGEAGVPPSVCPADEEPWSCGVHAYTATCVSLSGHLGRMFADCVDAEAKGDRPAGACAWLLPDVDCAACAREACSDTPDALRTWSNLGALMQNGWLDASLFRLPGIAAAAGYPVPTTVGPNGLIEACSPPMPCGEGAVETCAVPCTPCETREGCALCQKCPNGATCATCLEGDGGQVVTASQKAGVAASAAASVADSCGQASKVLATARTRCVREAGLDSAVCDAYSVPMCAPSASCASSTYTSPAIGEASTVARWESARISEAPRTTSPARDIRYSVLDAATGEAIDGFARVPYPQGGVLDLSGIAADAHPSLRLAAHFSGPETGKAALLDGVYPVREACMGDLSSMGQQMYFEPTAVSDSGRAVGLVRDAWRMSGCNGNMFLWGPEDGEPEIIDSEAVFPPYNDHTRNLFPLDMNAAGEVVGQLSNTSHDNRNTYLSNVSDAFHYSPEGGLVDVGAAVSDELAAQPVAGLGPLVSVGLATINDAGVAAGMAFFDRPDAPETCAEVGGQLGRVELAAGDGFPNARRLAVSGTTVLAMTGDGGLRTFSNTLAPSGSGPAVSPFTGPRSVFTSPIDGRVYVLEVGAAQSRIRRFEADGVTAASDAVNLGGAAVTGTALADGRVVVLVGQSLAVYTPDLQPLASVTLNVPLITLARGQHDGYVLGARKIGTSLALCMVYLSNSSSSCWHTGYTSDGTDWDMTVDDDGRYYLLDRLQSNLLISEGFWTGVTTFPLTTPGASSVAWDAELRRLLVAFDNGGSGVITAVCPLRPLPHVAAAVPFTWSRVGGLTLADVEVLTEGVALRPRMDTINVYQSESGWVAGGLWVRRDGAEWDERLPFRWQPATQEFQLAVAESFGNNYPIGIDDAGRVALPSGEIWDGQQAVEVGGEGVSDVRLHGLNADGWGYGAAYAGPEGRSVPVIVSPAGVVTVLQLPAAYWYGAAFGRTAAGEVLVTLYTREAPPDWAEYARTGLWDGTRYHFVDGFDPSASIRETYTTEYAWEGRVSVSPSGLVLGHAYGLSANLEGGFNRPYLWSRRGADDRMALLDWRVVYRTAGNPSFTLDTEVAGVCADSITNTATISTTTPQVTDRNDRSSATIPMNRADLAVTVVATPGVIAPEAGVTEVPVSFRVTVTNRGPGVAKGITLVGTGSEGFGGGSETLIEDLTLAAGASRELDGPATLMDLSPNSTHTASVSVSAATVDCDPANDTATATVSVGEWPNLHVGVTAPAQVPVNLPFTVKVPWGNNGNAAAPGATASLALPPGLSLVSAPTGATTTAGLVTVELGTVPAGATGSFEVTVVSEDCSAAGSRASFQADVTTTAAELDAADNQASAESVLAPSEGALAVSVVAGRGTVAADDSVLWTVSVTNPGLRQVDGAALRVALPSGTALVAKSLTDGASQNGQELSWQLGTLTPGAATQVLFRATSANTNVVRAFVTGTRACPAEAKGSVGPVVATGGVHVIKTANSPTVCHTASAPQRVTWTLTATNTSAAAVTCADLGDTLPAGLTLVAGSMTALGTPGTTTAENGTTGHPIWRCVSIAPGQAITLAYATDTAFTPTGPNDAAVMGLPVEATARAELRLGELRRLSNDPAIRWSCEPGLTLTKAWGEGCLIDGATATIALTVRNTGTGGLKEVLVVDALPVGLDFVSASAGTWDPATRNFRVTLPQLLPGASTTIEVQTRRTATLASGSLLANQAWAKAADTLPTVSNLVATVSLVCNDGNACTADSCAINVGCIAPPVTNGVSCSDGSLCTTVDTCQQGACVGAEPVVCTADSQCHAVGTCDPGTGACSAPTLPTGTACDDGSACTTGEICNAGVCGAGDAVTCDDANPCTADRCDKAVGCVAEKVADNTVCDDGNACSSASICRAGTCTGSRFLACDDGNLCTTDACDPETGCVADAVADGTGCDDGNACTSREICTAGRCGAGDAVTCDDANPCTAERCEPARGCVRENVADNTFCDDANACSSASSCQAGACAGTRFIACDDGNVCTTDTCDAESGCLAEPVEDGAACDDGDLCTRTDACAAGVCGGGDRVVCGEPGVCEAPGLCNPDTGVCDYAAKPGDVPVPIRMTNLGGRAVKSAARAVNAAGVVAGTMTDREGGEYAVVWTGQAGDDVRILGPGVATGLNDAGAAAGLRTTDAGVEAFFHPGDDTPVAVRLWSAPPSPTLLGPDEAGRVAGAAMADSGAATVALRGTDGVVARFDDGTAGARLVGFRSGVALVQTTRGEPATWRWDGVTATALRAPDGATEAVGLAIGASGHVAGHFTGDGGALRAALWQPDGTVEVVAPVCLPGGAPCLVATRLVAVAADGSWLGEGDMADGTTFAFRGADPTDPDLIAPVGATGSTAGGLTDGGLAFGGWSTAGGDAFQYALIGDVLADIPPIGPDMTAFAATDSGFVLGHHVTGNGRVRSFLWSLTRGSEDLGSLGGGTASAVALNASGVVVGHSATEPGAVQAFVTATPALGCLACGDDIEPPTLVCPSAPAPLACVGGEASLTLGAPSARDTCSFPVTVTGGPEADTAPLGVSEITWTATDALGNAATCSVTVTVVDTEAPTLTCPTDLTVDAAPGTCGATVEGLAPTVDDTCNKAAVRVVSDAPATFGPGETVVTFTAIDGAGLSSTCKTTVTVTDTSGLAIACDADLTVEAPADFCGWPESIAATVTQDCSAEIEVRSEASAFPIGLSEVTFEATSDDETASCVTRLTVRDVTPPEVACGAPLTLAATTEAQVFLPVVSDACGAEMSVSGLGCWRVDADGAATFVEGCGAVAERAGVLVGPMDADTADGPWRGQVFVRWEVTATDPSGNATTLACETEVIRDRDEDGVPDAVDGCIEVPNADQRDTDGDGVQDACDKVDDGIVAYGSGCAGGENGWPVVGGALGLLALMARRRRLR